MTEKNVTSDNKQVATKKGTELANPSVFMDDAGSGLENITADDLTIPRLKILQALSPEVNKRDGKYIEGAEAGDIVNTVTGRIYNEPCGWVEVLPVAYRKFYLEWQPRESGGGLVQQHTDAEILSKTTKDRTGADVLANGNYIQTSATHFCIVVDDANSYYQVMIPMAGTQLKKSRNWNSVMATLKVKSSDGRVFTPPTFSHKYKLSTVQESNDRGNWFGWNIELISPITSEEMTIYQAAKEFKQSFKFDDVSTVSSEEAEGTTPF